MKYDKNLLILQEFLKIDLINNMKIINSIKLWWKSLFKYKLTDEEKLIWNSIVIKECEGYKEWLEKTKGDDICGPWIKDITKEEVELIDKIHEHFYGEDWWIAVPISTAQVCSVMLDDIKNKVK